MCFLSSILCFFDASVAALFESAGLPFWGSFSTLCFEFGKALSLRRGLLFRREGCIFDLEHPWPGYTPGSIIERHLFSTMKDAWFNHLPRPSIFDIQHRALGSVSESVCGPDVVCDGPPVDKGACPNLGHDLIERPVMELDEAMQSVSE